MTTTAMNYDMMKTMYKHYDTGWAVLPKVWRIEGGAHAEGGNGPGSEGPPLARQSLSLLFPQVGDNLYGIP